MLRLNGEAWFTLAAGALDARCRLRRRNLLGARQRFDSVQRWLVQVS
jgi:hypothetical protein